MALLTHSMGANYILYFLRWVTENAGDKWIDEKLITLIVKLINIDFLLV